jgi:hypothetical protein
VEINRGASLHGGLGGHQAGRASADDGNSRQGAIRESFIKPCELCKTAQQPRFRLSRSGRTQSLAKLPRHAKATIDNASQDDVTFQSPSFPRRRESSDFRLDVTLPHALDRDVRASKGWTGGEMVSPSVRMTPSMRTPSARRLRRPLAETGRTAGAGAGDRPGPGADRFAPDRRRSVGRHGSALIDTARPPPR